MAQQPHVEPLAPLVLYHILGASLPDTAAAAPLWPAAVACARHNPGAVHRALEAPQELPDAALGNALFDAIVGAREGTVITDHAYEDVWSLVVYPDRRVRLAIPRLLDWLGRLDPADVAAPARYPYVLAAGQRRMFNANQIFRNPAWRRSDPDGARLVNPDDLAALGVRDGDWGCCGVAQRPAGRAQPVGRVDVPRSHRAAPWIRHGLPGAGRRAIDEWASHQSADVLRPS
jgi:hypothetical protein